MDRARGSADRGGDGDSDRANRGSVERPRISRRNLETNIAVPRRGANGDCFARNFWATTRRAIVEFRFRNALMATCVLPSRSLPLGETHAQAAVRAQQGVVGEE